MSAPIRLQLSRRKGFDLQAVSQATNGLDAINVARPSILGNPFIVGTHGTRAECVRLFLAICDGLVPLTLGDGVFEAARAYPYVVEAQTRRLKGKNLACWCTRPKPGEADLCHAAVLLGWVNNDDVETRRAALLPICEAVR
ncbi:DUF4326 domain-containing protein [Bosea massiliensis]|uniref:DUF4326 domain-containing protein n=1 Tax=Bosea massiliensis TaxID=151419 RepID=A0ABW0P0D9_9HYPH